MSSFLYFGATGRFQIQYHGIGPTESRVAFIILNCLVIFIQPVRLAPLFPWVIGISLLILVYVIYRDQKEIWAIDKPKFGKRK